MIHTALLALLPAVQEGVTYRVEAPQMYIDGEPYRVTVTATVEGNSIASMPSWAMTAAAFDLDAVPLETRDEHYLTLTPGQRVQSTLDLGPAIAGSSAFQGRDFRLGFGPSKSIQTRSVTVLRGAERGIDFMTLPEEQLADYDVVLQTVHGPIWLQLWPDVAPRHVRNFLDLAYVGFYDDTQFHRVVPGFMVQGGSEKPGRPAPRRLRNEFNDRRHVPGVLSMARLGIDTQGEDGNTIPQFDSATCEFFIVHKVSPHLDGQYTALGRVVVGMEAVERVVDSVKTGFVLQDPRTHRPKDRQTIYKAVVVRAPAKRPEPKQDR